MWGRYCKWNRTRPQILRFDETHAVANQLFATFAIVFAMRLAHLLWVGAHLLIFHPHARIIEIYRVIFVNLLPTISHYILRKPLCCGRDLKIAICMPVWWMLSSPSAREFWIHNDAKIWQLWFCKQNIVCFDEAQILQREKCDRMVKMYLQKDIAHFKIKCR